MAETENLKQALRHVLWLGGATDAGKTTVAQLLADRHHLQVYHYDRYDFAQLYHLAQTMPAYRRFLNASLEEAWLQPSPEQLVEWAIQTFRDRFPLVIGDLCALPQQPQIIAEGFGLTPELVAPLLSTPRQAVWLIPTPAFKEASMERRSKPSFRDRVSDPALARSNVLARDSRLAAHIRAEAESRGLLVYDVDGSRSAEAIADLVAQHFFERHT